MWKMKKQSYLTGGDLYEAMLQVNFVTPLINVPRYSHQVRRSGKYCLKRCFQAAVVVVTPLIRQSVSDINNCKL